MGARKKHLEDDEQKNLFLWAAVAAKTTPEIALMYHIPNGGKRDAREAARLKARGVKAGVPDIHLPVARGGWHGLYIEMKANKQSAVQDSQKLWLAALSAQGYMAVVCRGWVEAKEVIQLYISGRR